MLFQVRHEGLVDGYETLVKGIFPLVYSDKWKIVVGNSTLANRIMDRFRGLHNSQIKELASHVDFLSQEPVVSSAWEYIVATVEAEEWKAGDEILGESEEDGPGEMLVLAVLCKLAVISYVWDNVLAGVPNGDVASVSTLTNLLLKVWKEETRAVSVKQLMKLEKLDIQLDPLTALMEGRGVCYVDKVSVPVKKAAPTTAVAVETKTSEEANKLHELQRALDRMTAENERLNADAANRRNNSPWNNDRGRGGGDRGRGGDRGGRYRGRGGRPTGDEDRHSPVTLLHPGDTCTKCQGVGHKADSCPGVQGTIKCSRCGGTGHRVLYCTSVIAR